MADRSYNQRMVSRRRFLLSAAVSAPALHLYAQQTGASAQAACETNLPAPLLELNNRATEAKPITQSEREARLDRARELMKEYGLDAVVITPGASMLYFTGAEIEPSDRLFAYIIPQAAAAFIVCPSLEREHLAELLRHFPERETTISYLWQENENPYITLRRAFAEENITTGTVGLEEHTPFGFAAAIAKEAPALKLVSAAAVVNGCRSIKSPAEIALLRLANQITFDVCRAVYASCGPGDSNEKVVDLMQRAYRRSGVHGAATCNVGINSALTFSPARPQILHEGEMVTLNSGCTVEGYTSAMSRSFVYGTPADAQHKAFETVRTAQSAALAAAHAEAPAQAVDAAARRIIVDAGYGPGYDFFPQRVGHGTGLELHEYPSLVAGNTAKLMPGMVLTDAPNVLIAGKFGVRLGDVMAVTDSGAELFTPQSPSLDNPFNMPARIPSH